MEQTITLHCTPEEFRVIVSEEIQRALREQPIRLMQPDNNELWTAEMISACSNYSYPRVLEKIRNSKVPTDKVESKIAIRYADIEKIGVVVNPFKRRA